MQMKLIVTALALNLISIGVSADSLKSKAGPLIDAVQEKETAMAIINVLLAWFVPKMSEQNITSDL